jgi:type IV pilus assembly protein PilP
MNARMHPLGLIASLIVALAVTGCARDMKDLEAKVEEMKKRPGGRIEPLPQVKPYETFIYDAYELREPFTPDSSTRQLAASADGDGDGLQPDFNRSREYLEEFPLDTLRMVGTLELRGENYALIRTNDGAVHRVSVGNYIGQNHGHITAVSETRIDLTEIIPDGSGGWTERRTGIALSE